MSRDLLAIAGITLGLARFMGGGKMPDWAKPGQDPDTLVRVYGHSVKLGDLKRVLGEGDLAARAAELKKRAMEDPEFLEDIKRELGIEGDVTFGAAQLQTRWVHSVGKMSWEDIIGEGPPGRLLHPTSLQANRRSWVRNDPLANYRLGPPSSFSASVMRQEMMAVQHGLQSRTVEDPAQLGEHTISKPMGQALYGISALLMELYGAPLFSSLGMDDTAVGTLTDEIVVEVFGKEALEELGEAGAEIGGSFHALTNRMLLPDTPHGAVSYLHELWHRVDHKVGQRMVWRVTPEVRDDAPPGFDLSGTMSSMLLISPIGAMSDVLGTCWEQYLDHVYMISMLFGAYGKAAYIEKLGSYIASPDEAWARVGAQMTLRFAKRAKIPFFTTRSVDFVPEDQIAVFELPFIATLLLSAFCHPERDIRPSEEAHALREAVEGMHPTLRRKGRKLLPVLRKSYGENPGNRIRMLFDEIAEGRVR